MRRVRALVETHRGILSIAVVLVVMGLAAAMVISAIGLMANAVAGGPADPNVPSTIGTAAVTTTTAPTATATTATGTTAEPAVVTPTRAPAPAPEATTVAQARGPQVDVYDSARATAAPARVLRAADQLSGQLVFVVRARDGDWLDVLLPARPNGSTGWIRAADVTLTSHTYSVEVRLSAHRVIVRHGTDVVLEAPVGVGKSDAPTPGGKYYLKELIRPPDPRGAYGPYAYGLSGFSDVFASYSGGAGVIGIHGTNRPETVGTDVSDGCIRVTDEVVTRMVEDVGLPLGTPVVIVP